MTKRIVIEWTQTARDALAKLPKKVRRGLIDKANELQASGDPSAGHKRLIGALSGYFRITHSRYRAIYTVSAAAHSGAVQTVTVLFVAAGIRKEGDKEDVYRFIMKLLGLGLIGQPAAGPPAQRTSSPSASNSKRRRGRAR